MYQQRQNITIGFGHDGTAGHKYLYGTARHGNGNEQSFPESLQNNGNGQNTYRITAVSQQARQVSQCTLYHTYYKIQFPTE